MVEEFYNGLTAVGRLELLEPVALKAVEYYGDLESETPEPSQSDAAFALPRLAEVLGLQGDSDRSIAAFERANRALVNAYRITGQYEQALVIADYAEQLARRLISRAPERVHNQNRLAVILVSKGLAQKALDHLIPLVYAQLQRLARSQLGRANGATLQPTELVSEAYLKLIDAEEINWVYRCRKRNAERREGGQPLLTLNTIQQGYMRADSNPLVALDEFDEAIHKLEQLDPRQAQIVLLRFFGGLTID